jgi:uncharacterized protein (TIGR02466 family)
MNKIFENCMFFTPSYYMYLNDIDNFSIKKEIYWLKDRTEGRNVSNIGGWQSQAMYEEDLKKYLPEISKLEKEISLAIGEIIKIWEIEEPAELGNFWCNINYDKDYNLAHTHPQSTFSCVYYVEAEENAGSLTFVRPDLQYHYITPKNYNKYTYQTYNYTPEKSKLLIFPSYIEHYVTPNLSGRERISIAVNYSIKS